MASITTGVASTVRSPPSQNASAIWIPDSGHRQMALGERSSWLDHWHILPGQGQYYNPPMIRNGEKVTHEGYTTDLISDFSIEWLKRPRQVEALHVDESA
jgi:hypothetical protein